MGNGLVRQADVTDRRKPGDQKNERQYDVTRGGEQVAIGLCSFLHVSRSGGLK